MANFIAIPSEVLETRLQQLGFERQTQRNEVVYRKTSTQNPSVHILVYTSVRNGQSQVRAAGKDAIRVCTIFDNGRTSFGVGKFPPVMRVHSVESVLQRLQERIIDAAKRGKEWIAVDRERWKTRNAHAAEMAEKMKTPEVDFSNSPSYKVFLEAMGEEDGNQQATGT